jgi:hypothetical protein
MNSESSLTVAEYSSTDTCISDVKESISQQYTIAIDGAV